MIALQPSITTTTSCTEGNCKTDLKSKNNRHIQKQSPGCTLQENIPKFFSQNSEKNTCVGIYFMIKLEPETCNFIKKETPTRVFFCEFWNLFVEHLQWLLLHVGFSKLNLIYGLHFSPDETFFCRYSENIHCEKKIPQSKLRN